MPSPTRRPLQFDQSGHPVARRSFRAFAAALFLLLLASSMGIAGSSRPARAQESSSSPLTGASAPITASEGITGSVVISEPVETTAVSEAYGGPDSGGGTEGESPESASSTPSETIPSPVATRTYPVMSAGELWPYAVLLLGFALLLTLMLLNYFTEAQRRYFETVQELIGAGGVVPEARSIASFETVSREAFKEDGRAGGRLEDADIPPPALEAEGPTLVTVGIPATYTANREAKWSVEPDSAAKLDRRSGENVNVTALAAGAFTLKVSEGESESELKVSAKVPAEELDKGSLPFVGEGVGTLAIAVLLVVAVIILSFRGIMTSDAVATFLGGLLGYIFGVRRSE